MEANLTDRKPRISRGESVNVWSRFTCRALGVRGMEALIARPYDWETNVTTGAFPVSFTIRAETMKAILYDIRASTQR